MLAGLALVGIATAVSGASGRFEAEPERIEFEAALQALDGGETQFAVRLLEELAEGAPEGWRRAAYRAFAAFGRGEHGRALDAIDEALARSPAETSEPEWLYDELLRLAGKLRLHEIKEEHDRRLAELLERHYAARGGLERLKAMDNLVARGRMLIGESELPITLYRKRPRFYRLEVETAAGLQVTVCDGETAWRIDPGLVSSEPRLLDADAGARLLRESWFDDVLVRYRESGEGLFLAGEEESGDGLALRIEVTAPDGSRQTVFLDGESLLELRRVGGYEPEAQTVVSFEHGEVGRVWLPVRQRVEAAGARIEIVFDEYRVGEGLGEVSFELPTVRTGE